MKKSIFLTLLSGIVSAGGCDSSPCQNGGTCYDIGENSYECICNSFAGANCEIAPPSVVCESSDITVKIHRQWLKEKVNSDDYRHIYMGQGQADNPGCKAKISRFDTSELEVKLEKNFRQCGTQTSRSSAGDFVYQNTVFMSLQSGGIENGLAALVQWTCEYEDQYTVSYDGIVPNAARDDRAKARGVIGDFDLTMRPFIKPTFSTENLMTSYITPGSDKLFHVIPTDKKWISFQAALNGEAQLRGAKVALRKCFISNSRSPFQNTDLVELIHDGCPTVDGACHVYSSGVDAHAQFATNVRKFKQRWMEFSPFYFHCRTQLCPDGEYCPIGCGAREQGQNDEPLEVHVSSGPYFFQGSQALIERSQPRATLEEEDAEHSYNMASMMGTSEDSELENETEVKSEAEEEETLPLVGALALISLLAILVVSGLITIYNRRSSKKEQRNKRTATQYNLNFAHEGSLRATKNAAGYATVVATDRTTDLPGSRPAGQRPNYV